MIDDIPIQGTLGSTGRNPQTTQIFSTASETLTLSTPAADMVWAVRCLYLQNVNILSTAGFAILSGGVTDTSIYGTAIPVFTATNHDVFLHNRGAPILIGDNAGDSLKITTLITAGSIRGFVTYDEIPMRD